MELVELTDAIELRNEEFDVVRTIHMDLTAVPDGKPFSQLGYSIGRWEGDTLVVNTTRINPIFQPQRRTAKPGSRRCRAVYSGCSKRPSSGIS